MWSAKVTVIVASIWMYDFHTPYIFKTSLDCINQVQYHLAQLPEQLLVKGVGVHQMTCEWMPWPGKPRPKWSTKLSH